MDEIYLFKAYLKDKFAWLEGLGYSVKDEEILNQSSDSHIFFQYTYFNDEIGREITFHYYPSTRGLLKSTITVGFTKIDPVGNIRSFSLDNFLAYKILKREIKYEDAEKWRINVDPLNFEKSVEIKLIEIVNILRIELMEMLTGKEWPSIPVHHPRDDY